jgi:hypothetical protein
LNKRKKLSYQTFLQELKKEYHNHKNSGISDHQVIFLISLVVALEIEVKEVENFFDKVNVKNNVQFIFPTLDGEMTQDVANILYSVAKDVHLKLKLFDE